MDKRVVLITGASNGIGKEMALEFAKKGYCVAINYNKSKTNAVKLVEELLGKGYRAMCVKCDVSDYNEVELMINNVIKTFGHIDVLINNAGVALEKVLIDTNEKDIENIIKTNLYGTINCTKFASEHMASRNYGNIINISSVWGIFGASGESIYSASKGGIVTFTKAMAKELAYNGINVNCIAPGVVDTNMMNAYTKEEKQQIKNDIPLRRFAKPKEIARLALFLASKDASYITGQVIQIDGGYCL